MIIKGNLNLSYSSIKSLGEITEVKGNLDLQGSSIKSLGKLIKVTGDLNLCDCENLKDFGKLKQIGINDDDDDATIWLDGSGITENYVWNNKRWLRPNCDWNY